MDNREFVYMSLRDHRQHFLEIVEAAYSEWDYLPAIVQANLRALSLACEETIGGEVERQRVHEFCRQYVGRS